MKLERVAHWAEILGNFGVVVTLVLLVLQIQDNTQALRSRAIVERADALLQPFLSESQVPSILAKIKAFDEPEPVAQAYVERYGLTYEEGAVWLRHVTSVWTSLEAEYFRIGSPGLTDGRRPSRCEPRSSRMSWSSEPAGTRLS